MLTKIKMPLPDMIVSILCGLTTLYSVTKKGGTLIFCGIVIITLWQKRRHIDFLWNSDYLCHSDYLKLVLILFCIFPFCFFTVLTIFVCKGCSYVLIDCVAYTSFANIFHTLNICCLSLLLPFTLSFGKLKPLCMNIIRASYKWAVLDFSIHVFCIF